MLLIDILAHVLQIIERQDITNSGLSWRQEGIAKPFQKAYSLHRSALVCLSLPMTVLATGVGKGVVDETLPYMWFAVVNRFLKVRMVEVLSCWTVHFVANMAHLAGQAQKSCLSLWRYPMFAKSL